MEEEADLWFICSFTDVGLAGIGKENENAQTKAVLPNLPLEYSEKIKTKKISSHQDVN